jgi:hypothetical protein
MGLGGLQAGGPLGLAWGDLAWGDQHQGVGLDGGALNGVGLGGMHCGQHSEGWGQARCAGTTHAPRPQPSPHPVMTGWRNRLWHHNTAPPSALAPGAAQAVMAVLARDPAALSRAFQRSPLAAREGVAAALASLRVRRCRAHAFVGLWAGRPASAPMPAGQH